MHLRSPQIIFSHESALYLLDMTDAEPAQHQVTVKSGYNRTALKNDNIRVFSVKPSLHELGKIEMKTPFGHRVPVYDPERTLCDIIRSRNSLDIQIISDALRAYARRDAKDLRRLNDYAEALRVANILRKYMAVLL